MSGVFYPKQCPNPQLLRQYHSSPWQSANLKFNRVGQWYQNIIHYREATNPLLLTYIKDKIQNMCTFIFITKLKVNNLMSKAISRPVMINESIQLVVSNCDC